MNDQERKELVVCNKQHALQLKEKSKLAEDLIWVNFELVRENIKRIKAFSAANESIRAELVSVRQDLQLTKEDLQVRIQWLKEIMHLTTHNVRQPVASILGLSNLLEQADISVAEERVIINYIKESVSKLDSFTKDLVKIISLASECPIEKVSLPYVINTTYY
ncbi:MAG TPA: hypothetical protein VF868_04895 [Bacteroidia bacterium]|jgi:signal transduction histidine kinase